MFVFKFFKYLPTLGLIDLKNFEIFVEFQKNYSEIIIIKYNICIIHTIYKYNFTLILMIVFSYNLKT